MTVADLVRALPHDGRADPADARPRHSAVAVVPLNFLEQKSKADKTGECDGIGEEQHDSNISRGQNDHYR